ncbi:Unknown protein sequence [Pseudomonas amygdali pv. lachrymans]|uniref:Uncharacterized protein n=1 Tax=Pseudomonas amygdali pv. lachrymans TaxID=53707 RepID=A0ABR5L1W6_PSEAV|nr:Unknown protein sequence [Pseudomonas amygdali pv. lachrymans]KPC22937.1 Unknown protein sequence [Pseudomonas amygdali pv. lachrymans]RMP32987.1 hypothetical protein ALQ26_103028 [Pseudomonas amygdali pv. lachrymans]
MNPELSPCNQRFFRHPRFTTETPGARQRSEKQPYRAHDGVSKA